LGVLEEQKPLDETTFKISKEENGADSSSDDSDVDMQNEDEEGNGKGKGDIIEEETTPHSEAGGTWLQSLVLTDSANNKNKKRRRKKKKGIPNKTKQFISIQTNIKQSTQSNKLNYRIYIIPYIQTMLINTRHIALIQQLN